MMKLMRMLKMAKMKRPWSKSWKPQQQLDIKHILGPVLDQIDQLLMMNQIFWSKRRAPILLVKISALWATMASKIHKCWDTTTDTTDQAGKKAMLTSLCKEGGYDIYNTWAYLIVYHQRQTQKLFHYIVIQIFLCGGGRRSDDLKVRQSNCGKTRTS